MADYIARQEAIAYAISGSVRTLPTSLLVEVGRHTDGQTSALTVAVTTEGNRWYRE